MSHKYKIYGAGKPILFLGGLLQSEKPLGPFIDLAISNGYSVIQVDYRGHGVGNNMSFRLEDIISDIKHVIEQVSPEELYVIGEALGGTLALVLCNEYPDLITKACVSGVVCYRDKNKHKKFKNWFSILEERGLDSFIEQVIPELFSKKWLEENDHKIDSIAEILKENRTDTGLSKLLESAARYKLDRSALKNISQPILVVAGSHDRIVTKDHAKKLYEMLPNASYVELDAAHALTKECSNLLFDHLKEFFEIDHNN